MGTAGGKEQGAVQRFSADGTAAVLLAVADNPNLAVRCTFTELLGSHVEDDALDVWYMPRGCLALNAQTLPSSQFTIQALCRWHSDSQTPLDSPALLADLSVGHRWSQANNRTPILPEGYGRAELADFAQTELGIVVCQGLVIPPTGGPRE